VREADRKALAALRPGWRAIFTAAWEVAKQDETTRDWEEVGAELGAAVEGGG
jgi:hypothetical protein